MATKYSNILTKGLESVLQNTPIQAGKLRFTIDTRKLFLDNDNGERLEFTDFIKDLTEEQILDTLAPLPKFYFSSDTHKIYYYAYGEWVLCGSGLVLGETSTTAYRGDRGKTAYDHATTTATNPHGTTKSDVGLANVGNFKAVSTVASQELSDEEKSNVLDNIGIKDFVKSGEDANHGLVPAPPSTAGTTKYLREDGTWAAPPNTTYNDASSTSQGLMTAADKAKLDTIAENANNYTLPAASATALGGVKVGKNLSISDGVLNATDTTYSDMTAATASAAGTHGLVPAPPADAQNKFLRGDGTWQEAGSDVKLVVNANGTVSLVYNG